MSTEKREIQPDMAYETKDISISGLRLTAIIIGASAIVSFAVGIMTVHLLRPHYPNTYSSVAAPTPKPPYPLLQSEDTSKTDIMHLLQHEDAVLHSAGVNPDGSYHIPIAAAMQIIAQQGIAPTHRIVRAVSPGNTIKQNAIGPAKVKP